MSSVSTAALIAAAGMGSRLGQGPKAFVTVRGRALIELNLEALTGLVDEVVVALPAHAVAAFRARHAGITVVAGGVTRQDSVAAMLGVTSARVVLVHDVARPFLTPAVVQRVANAADSAGAATAVLHVADTVLDVQAGKPVPRAHLRLVQTPQGFDRQLLTDAHAAARADGVAATDDAELVRRLGHHVQLVTGSRLLHKLTGPEDLALATVLYDLWLAERGVDRSAEAGRD